MFPLSYLSRFIISRCDTTVQSEVQKASPAGEEAKLSHNGKKVKDMGKN
jgi:hypothetical protein